MEKIYEEENNSLAIKALAEIEIIKTDISKLYARIASLVRNSETNQGGGTSE